ncbi:hypothetical protein MesoLj131c_31090 [Mesorhizobium sp. 131-3-5]|nr:hypothetical protein MesoLj131c_31090 [Mesorhizobium sp. 131-3-5]
MDTCDEALKHIDATAVGRQAKNGFQYTPPRQQRGTSIIPLGACHRNHSAGRTQFIGPRTHQCAFPDAWLTNHRHQTGRAGACFFERTPKKFQFTVAANERRRK